MRPLNGDRLARELQVRGLTHKGLATLARISQAAVTNACNGRPVRPSTVAAIARVLVDVAPIPGAADIIGEVA